MVGLLYDLNHRGNELTLKTCTQVLKKTYCFSEIEHIAPSKLPINLGEMTRTTKRT